MLTLSRKETGMGLSGAIWSWSWTGMGGYSSLGHTLPTGKLVLHLNLRPPCVSDIEDLGFCASWWQVCVPMQEVFIISLHVFIPPCRSETRHVRYFMALLVFSICSYIGKFCFKTVNTISLQALHFYEGGNEKDKCYSCSLICLLSFPLSALQRVIWFILGVIWVTFTFREKIMVT